MIQRTSGSSLENHFRGPILVFRSPPVYRSLLDCRLNVSPPDPPHRARAEEGIADHTEPTPCQQVSWRAGRLFMSPATENSLSYPMNYDTIIFDGKNA
jgi:hypothetical protein